MGETENLLLLPKRSFGAFGGAKILIDSPQVRILSSVADKIFHKPFCVENMLSRLSSDWITVVSSALFWFFFVINVFFLVATVSCLQVEIPAEFVRIVW